jgi:hypothetical protein
MYFGFIINGEVQNCFTYSLSLAESWLKYLSINNPKNSYFIHSYQGDIPCLARFMTSTQYS